MGPDGRTYCPLAADPVAPTLFASISAFVRGAQRFVPALQANDVVRGTREIRAQAMNADCGLVDDFVISSTGPVVQVCNAPSTGATALLAIAGYIVGRALEHLSQLPCQATASPGVVTRSAAGMWPGLGRKHLAEIQPTKRMQGCS
jgi:L-2-hydroxyglutarate oxidase LhgO